MVSFLDNPYLGRLKQRPAQVLGSTPHTEDYKMGVEVMMAMDFIHFSPKAMGEHKARKLSIWDGYSPYRSCPALKGTRIGTLCLVKDCTGRYDGNRTRCSYCFFFHLFFPLSLSLSLSPALPPSPPAFAPSHPRSVPSSPPSLSPSLLLNLHLKTGIPLQCLFARLKGGSLCIGARCMLAGLLCASIVNKLIFNSRFIFLGGATRCLQPG